MYGAGNTHPIMCPSSSASNHKAPAKGLGKGLNSALLLNYLGALTPKAVSPAS